MKTPHNRWAKPLEDQLLALWDDASLSYEDIASRLGTTVNAVKRKAGRMGLPTRGAPCPAWPASVAERLRIMWADPSLTAAVIARELGIARNAVIGKVRRLKLPRRKPGRITGVSKAPRPKKERVRLYKPVANNGSPKAAKKSPVEVGITPPKPVLPVVAPLMLDLMKLDDTTCRYPIGEGPFLFCGHTPKVGSAYCTHHHALCYVPMEERRTKKFMNHADKRAA